MRKLSTDSLFGESLKEHRKRCGLTQRQLASEVGLTAKTVRCLEQGQGNLDSFRAVLNRLGIEIVGRNLPHGVTLGQSLATLRRHRRISQRELAARLGVTQPTILALEKRLQGRLTTLERMLITLGAGASLAPRGERRAFYKHVGNASVNLAWETPAALLRVLHGVFGRFDLDPCAARGRVGTR